jgi:hypothetical protein
MFDIILSELLLNSDLGPRPADQYIIEDVSPAVSKM